MALPWRGRSAVRSSRSSTINCAAAQLAQIQDAAAAGVEPLLIGCTQEAPLFAEAAASRGRARCPSSISASAPAGPREGAQAAPKIAALLAEAAVAIRHGPVLTLRSAGRCLVYGAATRRWSAAASSPPRLDVTLLLTGPSRVMPPRVATFPILRGTVAGATGHLGAFEVVVEGSRRRPWSRRATPALRARRGTGRARGSTSSSTSAAARRCSRRTASATAICAPTRATRRRCSGRCSRLTELVGEFDKPRYVTFEAELCAHSRSRRTGCTRCLDVCPTGAIAPAGDVVAIDPFVCAGCGACAGVCPTGAATYALPAARTRCSSACGTLLGDLPQGGRRAIRRCWSTTDAMAAS